jgi:hypothetical protein
MKPSNVTRILVLLSLVLFFAVATPNVSADDHKHCSYRGVAGRYAFTLNGVLILPTGPVPIAAIGTAFLDADGNVSGTESRTVGGDFADETLTGTYTVNPDCTATTTIDFYEAGQLVRTSVLSLVFDNNERAVRMVQKSLQLPNGAFLPVVVTVDAKRIFTEEGD